MFKLVRLMGRVSRRKEKLVNQPFEELSGLSLKSFHALYLISQDFRHPGELVRELGIPNSTATRLLDTLAAEGLVERSPDPQDQRQLQLSLTALGRERYETAWAQYMGCLHQGFGQLPDEVLERAVDALSQLEQALASASDKPRGVA
ncbi:MAG TPA: MarR family transcriptional regulator [Candidatus Obscuribacterales bacterium]